ncbi:GMC family oxidoreductase [Pseudomonas helleri]|uniref:GMC family oxidoreductase N-terminal domain-containing protein n=1 Tax=Pseudomonas helleri TaxID=1608996 RepID=UPI000F022420
MSNNTYDYIIVGAGSAGCVIAARLMQTTDAKVLLLEAGGSDENLFVRMPAGVAKVIPTKTWDYTTEPDPQTANRRMTIAQGKILGGSSSVNGMIYIRGQRQDYDAWATDYGCHGWGYDDLLPWFKKAEGNESLSDVFHGSKGPLPVSENRYRHPLSMAFVRAGQEMGLPYVNDFNGASQEGVGYYQTTTRNGSRASTAQTYLKSVRDNPNLQVITNALVHRVLIEDAAATGVAFSVNDGTELIAYARREVIVSSGANGSPKVLMLSGIGPAEHLNALGIKVVADLPVGQNLHDHLHLSINASLKRPSSLYGQDKGLKAILNGVQWLAFKSGVVTSNILEGAAFIDTTGSGRPDVQVHFLPVLDTWDDPDGLGKGQTHGITLKVGHLQPKSRGRVLLRSTDPRDLPIIEGNLLHHPDDVAGQVRAVKAGLKLLQAPSLQSQIKSIFSPHQSSQHEALDDDARLEEFVRKTCKTVYHPVGSCRMGQDPLTSVVDLTLRVHGIKNLRVIDCSIFPLIPSGNTNAPTIAVAERAVDLLLNTPSAKSLADAKARLPLPA